MTDVPDLGVFHSWPVVLPKITFIRVKTPSSTNLSALRLINPLSPKCDQHQISPCNINVL